MMSEKPFIKQLFDFDSTPVKSGAFAGMAIAAIVVVIIGVFLLISMALGILDAVFMIPPLLAFHPYFYGLPWSMLFEFSPRYRDLLGFGMAASILVNGAIIGMLVGLIAKIRQSRDA